jgi:hypothetical protein
MADKGIDFYKMSDLEEYFWERKFVIQLIHEYQFLRSDYRLEQENPSAQLHSKSQRQYAREFLHIMRGILNRLPWSVQDRYGLDLRGDNWE